MVTEKRTPRFRLTKRGRLGNGGPQLDATSWPGKMFWFTKCAVAWPAEIGVRVHVTPHAEVVGRVVGIDPVGGRWVGGPYVFRQAAAGCCALRV